MFSRLDSLRNLAVANPGIHGVETTGPLALRFARSKKVEPGRFFLLNPQRLLLYYCSQLSLLAGIRYVRSR
jgi:hypothetical protein